MTENRSPRRVATQSVVAALAAHLALAGSVAVAQITVIESFETAGIPNWEVVDPNINLQHIQSTTGVTHGANSMFLELYGGFPTGLVGTAVQGTWFPSDPDPTAYNAFNLAAQNPEDWQLEIDFVRTADAQSNLPNQLSAGRWSFPLIGQNNDGVGGAFGSIQHGISFFNTAPGTYKVAVPFSQIGTLGTDATFYQIQLGANNRFSVTAGTPAPGKGIKYYLDNIRIAPIPVLTPETIFSWETPDNPGTPNVNEALQGWSDAGLNAPTAGGDDPCTTLVETEGPGPGDAYAHKHSVSTYAVRNPDLSANVFPTHGTKSLTIDTTTSDPSYVNPLGLPQEYAFHWGSNYSLNADTDPGAGVTIDPAIKTQITTLATKINNAESISFDVAFSDPLLETSEFPNGTVPGFIGFAMHISDGRGTFYQFDAAGLDSATVAALYAQIDNDGTAPEEPVTFTFPLDSFTHRGGHGEGDFAGTTPGVNAVDLALWKSEFGDQLDVDSDANDNCAADGGDFLSWQRGFGNVFGPMALDTNTNFMRIGVAINANGPVVAHLDNFRLNTFVQSAPAGDVVPEPAAMVLTACAAAALIAARRRTDH